MFQTQTQLYLLGSPYLEKNNIKTPLRTKKQQRWIALLAYLAVKQKPISRQRLANLIWGDVEDSIDRLRKHTLDELKRKIGSDLLEVDTEVVGIRPQQVWVDVNSFRQYLTDYRLCQKPKKDACIHHLEKALAIYGGDFLGDYSLPESEDFYWWQIDQANALRQEFGDAVEDAITHFHMDLDKAITYANLWKRHDPDNLKVHAWILTLLEEGKKHSEAITYRKQLTPILEKWYNASDELSHLIDERKSWLKDLQTRHFSTQPPITSVLSGQLSTSELQADEPSFFEGYVSVLSDLASSNPLQAVTVASEIADILYDLKDSPQDAQAVLDHVEQMLQQTAGNFSSDVDFHLLLQRLNIYRGLGLTAQAVELLKRAEENRDYIDSLGDNLKGEWYCNKGLIECWVMGDYETALQSLSLSREHFRLCGQIKAEAGVTGDIGIIYWNQGDLLRAEKFLLTAKAQLASVGYYSGLIKTIGNLGILYLYQGRIQEAYTSIQDHMQLASNFTHLREIRRARGNQGIVKFHLGDYQGAIEDLEACIRSVKSVNEARLHATVNLSRCYMAQGDSKRAYELANWALGQAQAKGYLNIEIIARRALAECVPDQEAYTLLQEALHQATGKRRIDEAACLIVLSKLVQDRQREYWQKGARILHEMGAQAWLEHEHLRLPTL